MASLIDALRGGIARPLAETGGRTQEAQRLLTTKATGRAAGTTGPARAAEAERIEDTVAAQEQMQVQGSALEQLDQLKQRSQALTQETQQAVAGEQEALLQLQQRASNQTADLLESLRQDEGRLSLAQRGATLEQAAFGLRLANDQYLYGLQDAGRRRRLDDEATFKLELQKEIFANMESLLKDDLAFKEMMALSDADFSKLLANIDINAAIAMANDAVRASNIAGGWTGAGQLASAGAEVDWSKVGSSSVPTSLPSGNNASAGTKLGFSNEA